MQEWVDVCLEEGGDLFRRAANELGELGEGFEFWVSEAEVGIFDDGGKEGGEVVVVGEVAELFVEVLTAGPFFGGKHEDVFHAEVGKVGMEVLEGGGGLDMR